MKTIEFNKFNVFYKEHKREADALICETLDSGKYIRDKNNKLLEHKLCNICDRKYALTTASCTDALFFALKASGIEPGDEVILPSFSYIASLSPILMCGAIPVFADINPNTLVLDIDIIEDLINKKTKAIIFVQLFGHLTDLSKLKNICTDNDIILIEDAAQAIGSKLGEIKGASQGDISCVSFDPTKIVSAFGTGGAVLTNNEKYFNRIKKLVHHGRNDYGEFEVLGYNSKIPEFNAALINFQLEYLEKTIAETNNIAEYYISQLKDISEVKFVKKENECHSTYHKFVIFAVTRDELKNYLSQKGIETRIHYSPLLNEHKLLQNYKSLTHDLTVSRQVKKSVISLPIYPGLTYNEIDYICDCIRNFYKL